VSERARGPDGRIPLAIHHVEKGAAIVERQAALIVRLRQSAWILQRRTTFLCALRSYRPCSSQT
jgi:hypothetical protein